MRTIRVLLEITVYSWILFTAIMLIKKLVKKHSSPALHYLIWFLFIARLCIPVTLDSSIRLFVIPEFGASTEQSIHTGKLGPMDSHSFDAIPMEGALSEQAQWNQVAKEHDPKLSQQSAILAPNPTGTPAMEIDWGQVVMGLWLTGIAGVLTFFIWTSAKMNKKIKNTITTPSEKIITMLDSCKRELHIKKPIAIHVIDDITTPALMVSWNPKLLFPAHMIGTMKDEQILFALRHELTHFKRKDHLVSLLLRVLEAVYWFNPIVWIASKKISMDMESACDSRVVKAMGKVERSYYASTILEMFSQEQSPQFILGMANMGTRGVAEKRIRGIYMKGKTKSGARLLVTALTAVLILSCFTTACQPTPEASVVVGKGDSKLDKIIAGPPVSTELAKPYEVPAKLNYKLEATDVFFVDVHANVSVPDVDAYPVVATQKDTITQEQADKLIKVLLEGKPLYWPNEELTKDQIQNSIDYYKKKLDMVDANEMDSKIRKDLVEASGYYLSADAQSPDEQKDLYKGMRPVNWEMR